ncbi:MAG: hypothetical protein IT558_00790 [Alphaproteobacteria bacterium]|nr:hypothetical protein [Alphaproteobacteria bacterium]
MTRRNDELWQSEAAKIGGQALAEKLIGMADSLESLTRMEDRLATAETNIKTLFRAFPSEDIDGHRRAHEAMIEDINTRKRLTQAIQEKTISGLIWAGIVFVGGLLWTGFMELVRK